MHASRPRHRLFRRGILLLCLTLVPILGPPRWPPPTPALAQTSTFTQIVPASADTFFAAPCDGCELPRGNEGNFVGGWFHAEFVAFLRFDLEALIPRDATLRRATLRLYCTMIISDDRMGRYDINLTAVSEPWDEATLVAANRPAANGPGLSWRLRDCSSIEGGSWQERDLTDFTTRWHKSEWPNHGIQLSGPISPAGRANFLSRESGDPDLRPQLVVEFDALPTASPSPSPSSTTSPSATAAPSPSPNPTLTSIPSATTVPSITPSPRPSPPPIRGLYFPYLAR